MNYSLKPRSISPSIQESPTYSIEEFIGYLFSARDKVHLLHLKSESYAQHVALNDLYDGLLDIIDTLVETAQCHSLLNISIPESKITCSATECVQEILDYVRMNRSVFPYSFQANIVDTIEEILSKTLYKLRFLK